MASVTFDNVSKRYPNGHLGVRDMTLEIADGELLVLVGPSGCGKSTALRSVAGLEDITAGSLRIGNRAVQDLPPKDRDVAMVFQNYALYPHMTVAQNIGFALKLAKRPKQEIRTRVLEVARSLQLEDWLDRKPAQLSGGQRQRVAMGRAIVRDPAVFLMDEPLSNLDAKLRVQVRTEIARLQRSLGTTTIYVTHDQIEAMTMGDRVAVMRDGMLQQVAPPEVLYDEPDNAFVATFIGSPAMSLLEGRIEDLGEGALGVRLGSQVLPLPASVVAHRPTLSTYIDRPVVVGIRPEHLDDGELGHREGDVTAPLDAHVERRESLGSEVLLHVSVDARPALTDETRTLAAEVDDEVVASLEHQASVGRATIIARVDPRTRVQPDQAVQLAVRTDVLHFFDPEHGRAIRGTRLPEGFTLGVATSAHQIEGGMDLDGGGRSIWDTFAEVPGAIRGGDSGSAGVDHRRRMAEDVSLLADLGIRSYRFSIAWPRVQPGGSGPANQQGLDFYRSLVDALHEHGIEPLATLYHWDLPQELEDAGGWPARDTAERFAEYAHLVGAALGEGVAGWRTLNEPWCSAVLGYSAGRHAPGRTDPAAAVAASHHLLLGHGLAVDALRSVLPAGSPVGLTINPYPVVAAGERDEDLDAVRRVDGIANRLWLAPVLTGAYPDDVADDLAPLGLGDLIRPGDLDVISRPIDALGLNYSRRHHVRFSPGASADAGQWPGSPDVELVEPSGRHTDGGWAIEPEGLAEVLRMVAAYDPPPLYVEECGAAFDDVVGPDGEVDDAPRQAFLRDHLDVALRSVGEGIDLRGFYAWTYLDNFEWAEGYAHRFGIVHVDRATGARTPKASARWLGEVARTRLLPW